MVKYDATERDALDVALQEVEELLMELAKNENGRDQMPYSTKMWQAVSEQNKIINPLVLPAAARRCAAG